MQYNKYCIDQIIYLKTTIIYLKVKNAINNGNGNGQVFFMENIFHIIL